MTLASLNPNLQTLRLDLCGRMTCAVVEHLASSLASLARIELVGPFLVRPDAWKALFAATSGRLEGFLITQSPRFDWECLLSLVEHAGGTLSELRLAEVGLLADEWLDQIKSLENLERLNLSYPSQSLSDDAVIDLLETVGERLTALDLSGHVALTDNVLVSGVAAHCRRLQDLTISSMDSLTDEGVAQFFEALLESPHPPIPRVDLSRNHELADAAFDALLAHSGQALERLSVNSWRELSLEALMRLGAEEGGGAPRLEWVDIGWCREADDYVVKALLDGCEALRTIKCFGCNRLTENCPRKASRRVRSRAFSFSDGISLVGLQRRVRIFGNEAHTAGVTGAAVAA